MIKRRIVPQDKFQYFFGYYDLQPYDKIMQKHLACRASFMDRLPKADDVLELGYTDTQSGAFKKIAQTRAWNFQQGALYCFYDDETVTFNDFDGEKYINRVCDIGGKELCRYSAPFASVSPDGERAVSINFGRIYDFRAGYGYCNVKDPFYKVAAPEEDGIFLWDLKNAESRLLLSYKDMKKKFRQPPFTDEKLVVNHITFSPSGEKCVFLLRNFAGQGKKWGTVLAVIDIKGNVKKLTDFEVNSHYSWKDDKTLMIYSGLPEWGIYFVDVETGARRRLYNDMVNADDIHCNYSPNRRYFIGDGYPDEENRRSLYLYDFEKSAAKNLMSVYSEPPASVDIRCDLHARWSPDGKRISYDTTENGRREIYELELEEKDLDV